MKFESRRACPELVERGRLKKLSRHDPEFGQRIGNSQSRNSSRSEALGSPGGNFQSSLRDFSSLESLPRTASWAKFSRPCGTNLAIARFSRTHFSPCAFLPF